jgi:hypothetical protein
MGQHARLKFEPCTPLLRHVRLSVHPCVCMKSLVFEAFNLSMKLNIILYLKTLWVRGSVVVWGTMLQAGRSRARFPMRALDSFLNWPNPSSRTMALGSTKPLTVMSTRIIPGGKGRPVLRLTTWSPSVSRLCKKCESLDLSQPFGPPQTITGTALPFYWKTLTTF